MKYWTVDTRYGPFGTTGRELTKHELDNLTDSVFDVDLQTEAIVSKIAHFIWSHLGDTPRSADFSDEPEGYTVVYGDKFVVTVSGPVVKPEDTAGLNPAIIPPSNGDDVGSNPTRPTNLEIAERIVADHEAVCWNPINNDPPLLCRDDLINRIACALNANGKASTLRTY